MKAETKAAIKPATMAQVNSFDKVTGFFQSFNNSYAVAPPMTGIAKKKEKSARKESDLEESDESGRKKKSKDQHELQGESVGKRKQAEPRDRVQSTGQNRLVV
jgi:hypothetical protein